MSGHPITGIVACKKCHGEGVLADGSDCDRCSVDGLPTGVDPTARDGCCPGEEHEHD